MLGKQSISLLSVAMAAAVAAGCGGGQSAGSSAGATMHTSRASEAVLSYFGQPKPQFTSSSGNVTVLGQAGATFSTVTLEPAPNLADTFIAFARSADNDTALYTMSYATLAPQQLYQSVNGALNPGISAYGAIAFNNSASLTYTIRPDGTGLKSFSFTGPSHVWNPVYSVDGTNRVAFTDLAGGLWVGSGAGGTASRIQTNAVNQGVAWNPTGTEIAYAVVVTGGNDIFEASPSGGTATDITPPGLVGMGVLAPVAWSPDGVTILATYVPVGSGSTELIKFSANDFNFQVITPTEDSDYQGAYSPDGSKMVLYRGSANEATPGLYLADSSGLNQNLLLADPSVAAAVVGTVGWSPFLPKETVVASSGSTFYHQAASGFLLSQSGNQFGSLVAFTAGTPADAAIQAPSASSGNAPLAFTLTADSITSIGYTNNYFNPGTTLTLTSTPSVVVTVDAFTGQVDLVAPASAAKPLAAKNADGTLTYKAPFKAIYDGKGRNLAPSGAASLTVDPRSGKLVRFA